MAEPVDVVADTISIVGALGSVGLKVYNPPTPIVEDVWDAAVTVRGVRMRRKVEERGQDEGGGRVTRATWYLVTAGTDLDGDRPVLKSLIVDGSEEWVIDSVNPDTFDVMFECETTLSNG